MSWIGEYVVWPSEEQGIWTGIRTNVDQARLLAKLERLGVAQHVLHVCPFNVDRAKGGPGYVLLWSTQMRREEIIEILAKL